MSNVPVKSVKKAFDLLSIVLFEDVEDRGFELSTLARKMNMPNNSAHNLLKTMSVCGYIRQLDNGRYTSGKACGYIGIINRFKSGNLPKIQTLLKKLSEKLGESVVLTMLVDGRRVVMLRHETTQNISINLNTMNYRSFYQYCTGRVLAAFATQEQTKEIIDRNGSPIGTWEGIANMEDYYNACALIRKTGVCTLVPDGKDTASFACSVIDSNGVINGALGCHAPLFRCPQKVQKKIIQELKITAEELLGEF